MRYLESILVFFATGGIIPAVGFITLGIIWFYTTLKAFLEIKEGRVWEHEKMMIYSYAACFAAVTLRLEMPLLVMIFKDFIIAYQVVAWLCWIPNLMVAYFMILKKSKNKIVLGGSKL